jgi:hypothetical protein
MPRLGTLKTLLHGAQLDLPPWLACCTSIFDIIPTASFPVRSAVTRLSTYRKRLRGDAERNVETALEARCTRYGVTWNQPAADETLALAARGLDRRLQLQETFESVSHATKYLHAYGR